jgi:hypothetical protein
MTTLFENIKELGSNMSTAIKNLADEMLGKELSNSEVTAIVDRLKLSDLLLLDTAYTANDREKVAQILNIEELSEYSMGRNVSSAAASRPGTTRKEAPGSAPTPSATGNATQTNRSYSSGASNKTAPAAVGQNQDQDEDDEIEETSSTLNQDQTVVDMVGQLQRNAGIK